MTKTLLIIPLTLLVTIVMPSTVGYGCTSAIIHKDIGYDSRPMALKAFDWNAFDDFMRLRKSTSYSYMSAGASMNCIAENGFVGFVNDYHGGGSQDLTSFVLDLVTHSWTSMSEYKTFVEQNHVGYGYQCFVISPGDVRLWESTANGTNYEYDPVNPTRQSQPDFSGNHKYVVRANGAFETTDHTEPSEKIDEWNISERNDYLSMKAGLGNAVDNDGKVSLEELVAISRGSHVKSATRESGIMLGVKFGENKKYQTFLYAQGRPTYSIFVPVWYDLHSSDFSQYVSNSYNHGDISIAYWAEACRTRFSQSWFQNNIMDPVVANIVKGVKDARTMWFAGTSIETSYNNQISSMHSYGAAAAYHALRSAYVTRSGSTSCNEPPEIVSFGESINGAQLTLNPTVNESTSYCEIDWGDGATTTASTVASESHTYEGTGTRRYHVTIYVRDDNSTYASANVQWKYITISDITPPAKPTGLHVVPLVQVK